MSEKIFEIVKDFDSVVWDWNGTLLNDLDVVLRAEAEHFPEYGVAAPTPEERKAKFCFPIQKYYENLGFDFSKLSFPEVNARFMKIYEEKLEAAPLFAGTVELLKKIKAAGKRQFVLSAAPHVHLKKVLEQHQISDFFDAAYGLPHENADSKIGRGKELIRDQNIDPKTTILIGDTDHDHEVATALGFEALLIAEGHKPYESLIEIHHRVLRSRS